MRLRQEEWMCKASLGYIETSYLKTNKRTGGVTQVVECLLCKLEALSSNPFPPKNK
jgi:hypothetical protein